MNGGRAEGTPATCLWCRAAGISYPNWTWPTVQTDYEYNCGTHGGHLNYGKKRGRLWMSNECYRRTLAKNREEMKQASAA